MVEALGLRVLMIVEALAVVVRVEVRVCGVGHGLMQRADLIQPVGHAVVPMVQPAGFTVHT